MITDQEDIPRDCLKEGKSTVAQIMWREEFSEKVSGGLVKNLRTVSFMVLQAG